MIHHRRTKRRRRKLYRRSRRNCRGGATSDASRQRKKKLNLSRKIQTQSEILDNVNASRKYIADRRTAVKEKKLIEKLESKSLPPAQHNEMIGLIRQKSQTLSPQLASPKWSTSTVRGKTRIKKNTRPKTREQTRKETIANYKKNKRYLKWLRKRQEEEERKRQEEEERKRQEDERKRKEIMNPWAKINERRIRGRTFSPRPPPTPSNATMMQPPPTPTPTP